MKKIYILKKYKIIRGPYTIDHLKKVGIKEYDMIWYEGLSDWTPVTKIDSFKSVPLKGSLSGQNKNGTILRKLFSFLR